MAIIVLTTVLLSVNMTISSSFPYFVGIITQNKTTKTSSEDVIINAFKQKINGSSIVLPINPTQVGTLGQERSDTTSTGRWMLLEGDPLDNPFYGTGLYVNWTSYTLQDKPYYNYYYIRVDISKMPLSLICYEGCFCQYPPNCVYWN